MNTATRNATFTALALAIIAGGLAIAGPLTPPVGPVGGSFKTLSEVEPRTPISSLPFTISTSGSYYLTGNLTGPLGQDGITVNADDVTIDLGGFTMTGGPGQTNAIKAGQRTNVTVRNGTIKGWAAGGVAFLLTDQGRIESVSFRNCPNSAIFTGEGSLVRNCTIRDSGTVSISTGSTIDSCTLTNVSSGINSLDGSVVTNCVVANCTGGNAAIYLGGACTVTGCSVIGGNSQGISVAIGSTVSNCSVRGTGLAGFVVGGSCTVTNNTATNNGDGTAAGFEINGSGNRIDGNLAVGNGHGFRSNWTDNLIVRNAARANTAGNYTLASNESAQILVNPGVNFVATNPWANFAY